MSKDQIRASGPSNVRVLLADTNWWANSARLAMGLAETGCEVFAICPKPNHALTKTHAVQKTFRYRALHPIDSLISTIEAVNPDIIVPACDRSVRHLHELHAQLKAQGNGGTPMMALIERSLGAPASHPIVASRYDLLTLAREEGVLTPDTTRIHSQEDLDKWSARQLYPWVLKADGTWGGGGVRVIRSMEDAQRSLYQLEKMSRFTRSIKRLVVNRDAFWLREWWVGAQRSIVAQSYIYGRPANCAAFCWMGKVLAIIAVEVVRADGATGPASIVSVVNNSDMTKAAEKIAARLRLSGFFGLDFMIEEETKHAYLIEMNPRLAPPSHIRLGKGRDLAGALWAQVSGQPSIDARSVTQSNLIAYFPQGSNDGKVLGDSCFQDIPQEEPELVAELLNPFPDRTPLFRMIERLTRKSNPGQKTEGDFADADESRNNLDPVAADAAVTEAVGKARARSTLT
jgi:hypothetical protein